MSTKNFIVAIELSSTKIIGVAGQRNTDGSFTLTAIAKEDVTSCIRKGVVYNTDKTVQSINNIISKLQKALKSEISQVYVGLSGLSIHSEHNTIIDSLDAPTIVSQAMINSLMDANRATQYKDFEILDVVTHEYKVDNVYQSEPAGIECNKIEGNFLNIIQRKKYYKSLDNCFAKAGVKMAEVYLAPIALADAVLTDTEKRNGCVLIDLGAETTTVQVYYKDVLRHIAVIPLGGYNITKDLLSFQIEESEAEKMKLKHASAYTDTCDIDVSMTYKTADGREIESKKFISLVEARVQEIVKNALNQIPEEYNDKLVSGIVITGGVANMKNIEKAFTENTKDKYKLRKATFINTPIHTNNIEGISHNCMSNTILGILLKGELNCAGEELSIQTDMFAPVKEPAVATATVTSEPVSGTGKIQTAAERAAEKEQEIDFSNDATDKEKEPEKPKKPKKPSFFDKVVQYLKDFSAPEEE